VLRMNRQLKEKSKLNQFFTGSQRHTHTHTHTHAHFCCSQTNKASEAGRPIESLASSQSLSFLPSVNCILKAAEKYKVPNELKCQ